MTFSELYKAFISLYGEEEETKVLLQKYWESIDFTSSDDPYVVAEDAASSSYFTEGF